MTNLFNQLLPKLAKTDEGIKGDAGKVRTELIPYDALWEVAKVLTSGAVEYGDRNWEKGIKYSRIFGAMTRHAFQWFFQRNRDSKSGHSHMAHAVTNGLFLLAYEVRQMKQFDNRPETEITAFMEQGDAVQ